MTLEQCIERGLDLIEAGELSTFVLIGFDPGRRRAAREAVEAIARARGLDVYARYRRRRTGPSIDVFPLVHGRDA